MATTPHETRTARPAMSIFPEAPGAIAMSHLAADPSRVNRTHRVVRERAKTLQARRSRMRSLYLPLGICSALLVAVYFAVWSILAQYEQTPNGAPGASDQMMVLMLWSVPISAALLAVVWYRQSRQSSETSSDGGDE